MYTLIKQKKDAHTVSVDALQRFEVQGSGLPSRGQPEVVEVAADVPGDDAEASSVEAPDVDGATVRVDVAGADVDLLEQPLPRGEEVQDHRVDDLPRRGNLGDAVVDERLLLAPVLAEQTLDGDLADEPPASRLGALGELLVVEPVLRAEQPLASLLSHVEEREPHVGDEDVRLGAGLERLLIEGDGLESDQVGGADGTEVLHDLGDAEEVLAHDLANRPLAGGLAVVDSELHEHLAETAHELVASLDHALCARLRGVDVASAIMRSICFFWADVILGSVIVILPSC